MISEYDAVIAGTEEINKEVIESANNVKIISRVGVGLDSIDLKDILPNTQPFLL